MTTIHHYLDAFLTDIAHGVSANTVRAYRADLTVAAHALPHHLDQITLQNIKTFLEQHDVATATSVRRTTSLRRFFAWATEQDLCHQNPLQHYQSRPRLRRLPRPIRSVTDMQRIDAAIGKSNQPYRLLFTILRETGMRVGEVLALKFADVSLDAGREGLRIRESKNHTERIAILGPEATPKSVRGLRAWVRQHHAQPPFAPLFRSNRGTRVAYDTVHYHWSCLCQHIGLVHADGSLRYMIHQLRHTRGSELVQQGQRMEIVQRVLGHLDPRSTQGYAELDDMQVRAALEHGERHHC